MLSLLCLNFMDILVRARVLVLLGDGFHHHLLHNWSFDDVIKLNHLNMMYLGLDCPRFDIDSIENLLKAFNN